MFKPWPKPTKKVKTKNKPKSELSKLDAKLWEIFSEYTRRKYADENGLVRCFTCRGWFRWQNTDCGHGISRRFLSTKFHEQNNHPQCKKCNILSSGEQYEYMIRVDEVYGHGTAEKLRIMSKQPSKFTRYDYEYKIQEYKEKLKQLK
jgi:hypothetical protein